MVKPRQDKPHEHCPNLPAIVHRSSGQRSWATITRLWYDGCEIASKEAFDHDERLEIEIGSMGSIRAAVATSEEGTVSVRFVEESPV